MVPTPVPLLRYGLVSLTAGFVILALITFGTVWFVAAEQANRESTRHAVDVARQLRRLEALLLDAETGQRGYMLTGDDTYLAPYNQAIAVLDGMFESIGVALAEDAPQTQALATLRATANDKLSELKTTIDARQSGKVDEALSVVRAGTGKAFMDKARETIARMIDAENRLVILRRGEADGAGARLRMSVIAGGFLLAVVAITTLWFFMRQIQSVIAARDALASANDRLMKEILQRERIEEQLRQSQKMEALGQLTGGLAHDFNNMLAIVIGSLNLLERRHARGETTLGRYISAAVEGATRAAVLTQRLLAFSRQQPLTPQPIEPNKFVAGMSDMLRRTLGHEVRLETVLAGGLWRTHADPGQLENAILNLAINARDAMPEGGRLTIETANAHLDDGYASRHVEVPAGQYVLIAVTDTGTGMTPDVVAKAFDPFFTTKETGKGTGLGLSQVYGFVKQSSGHVKVYSEVAHGTTIKLYLPRFFGDEDLIEQPAFAGEQLPSAGSAREVILVVEDEEQVREMSVEALRELGYTVFQAASASAALRIIDAQPEIAMLFTDIVMPEVNGRRLADEAQRRRPDLKVLFTTGYTRNAIVHNGVLDPGVHLVSKPFTMEQLALKVRAVLETR